MFHSSSRSQQETPKEDRRMHLPKRCEYNNNVEDNSPKTLSDENYQDSSLKK